MRTERLPFTPTVSFGDTADSLVWAVGLVIRSVFLYLRGAIDDNWKTRRLATVLRRSRR
jgi:hypothetical protein